MKPPDQDYQHCRVLFVTDANYFEDSWEAESYRELLRTLLNLGLPCEVLGRFVVPDDQETDPGPWLAEPGWADAKVPQAKDLPPTAEQSGRVLRGTVHGLPVTLWLGSSTKPHALDEAERTSFLGLLNATLGEGRPDVVLVRAGPLLAATLAAARSRHVATVALQPDWTPRDPAPFRDADIVLTPTRLAAEALREAFGLPCVHLPPVIPRACVPAESNEPGVVVFDNSAPGLGGSVFSQVAEELRRRQPSLGLRVLGALPSTTLPGDSIQHIGDGGAEHVWNSAQVLLAPTVSWEALPWAAVSALSHGVPVIAADRGAALELLEGAGLLLPLPDRITAASPTALTLAELAPWVETVLRLCSDRGFAASQRSLALLAGQRWSPEVLAPQYARLLVGLAGRSQQRHGVAVKGAVAAPNGTLAAVGRLREMHPWPGQRPPDNVPSQEQGWLDAGTEVLLSQALTPGTQVVLELGAWLGLSSRFIADHAQAAIVISVDHWQGSPEHQAQERFRKLLPQLYESYLARCWDYRARLVPLRMTTLEGLRTVADAGLKPDLIFIDAEHSYEAVTTELSLASHLFPDATLTGDDYNWSGVREAVNGFAQRQGQVVERFGARGWRLRESWQAADANLPPPGRGQCVVLVPHHQGIEWECEQALRQLESEGVRVVRRGGCSAIDVARNDMLSTALHEEAEAMLFIDSDIGFDVQDALRLLARPEPVVSGVYTKKGQHKLATIFADEVKEVLFGPEAAGLYPVKFAAAGFLRVRAEVLRRLITELKLPLCNTHWGKGIWPFFQPMIIPHGPGKQHYLGEDWAFSHRVGQIGVTPLADTSIRLWHWGRYGFSWEDAGISSTVKRFRSFNYRL